MQSTGGVLWKKFQNNFTRFIGKHQQKGSLVMLLHTRNFTKKSLTQLIPYEFQDIFQGSFSIRYLDSIWIHPNS